MSLLQLVEKSLDKLGRSIFKLRNKVKSHRKTEYHFDFRKDDIFIVTYPRSGTTWMQMIMHQMTTDGNMDFEHISEVCPWYERTVVKGVLSKSELAEKPSPRVFKTHLRYEFHPLPDCKYICVVRDGKDVAYSYYHFYQSFFNFNGTFSEFYEKMFLTGKVQNGLWFTHVKDWLENQKKLDILFLDYSDLKRDFRGYLKKISEFCQLDLSEEKYDQIERNSSFEFMKEHEDKFDHIKEAQWEIAAKTKRTAKPGFIREGKVGKGKVVLDDAQIEQFDMMLDKYLPEYGRKNLS